MWKNRREIFFIAVLMMQFLLSACGSNRAGGSIDDLNKSVAGVVERTDDDRDGDGISNDDEVNIYGTNPDSNDTDGDGISDSDELFVYDTNVTNSDTDGDGLTDGEEIFLYDTNASNEDSDTDGLSDYDEVHKYPTSPTNSDTDGDCLLDSFEILNYETNATNKDTDGDGVEDGLEVYGSLTTICITDPETLIGGENEHPAQDNVQNPDVIDALDPLNDSDGDGEVNVKELECKEGDPKDKTKKCPTIEDTVTGASLISAGFIYVPGGFDVDGDGIDEKGFWTSSYHARAKPDVKIDSSDVNTLVGKFNTYIQNNFFMVNSTDKISPIIHGYSDETLSDTLVNEPVPIGQILEFGINLNPRLKKRVSGIMPFMATLSLSRYTVYDSEHNDLHLKLVLPSLKQYAQIQKLLEADKKNGGDGYTIRNGLLGIDKHVPLISYSKVIHEFGYGYKEYLRSIMQMKEGKIVVCTGCPWVKDWMGVNKDKLVKNPNETQRDGTVIGRGTDANLNVGMGTGPNVDDYGVLVRAGEVLDLTIGVTGTFSDALNEHNGIGFRAATAYEK